MPFEDLTGNSGFTSDSEGANATLDINMSEDSARNLWDVQAAIQQIAVDFQTAVRSAADFQSYLISIRETGQTIQMPSLGMEGGEGGGLPYAGGRFDQSSSPIGVASASESGQASRVAEMEDNSSGIGGGIMAARSGMRAGDFINQATNTALMAGMGGGHGDSRMANEAYSREYQYASNNMLDPRVLGASYQGQVGTPHAFAARQLLSQGIPAAQQFLRGGGVGGFTGMLGRAGAVGAAGYLGWQLADAAMETYASSRALAISTNNSQNGIGWGFGTTVSRSGMAMSPFVSQDQANAIYETAINQGWASGAGDFKFQQGSFGQSLNFMYGAVKDYGMEPQVSSQLLQNNALGAGESIQALSAQLLTLKQSLDGTGVSMSVMGSAFTNLTSGLIAAGASGADAAVFAGGTLRAFAGNTYLQGGRGAEIVQKTMVGSQQTQNILAGLTGTIPGAALAGDHLMGSSAQMDKLISRFANQSLKMSGLDDEEKAAMFMQTYNSAFGTQIGMADARNLMVEYAADPNLLSTGMKKYKEQLGISYKKGDEGRSAWDRYTGSIKDTVSGPWWNKAAYASAWLTSIPSLWDESGGTQNTYRNYSPEVQNILDNSPDSSKVVVVDESGNVVASGKDDVSGWFSDEKNFNKFAAAGSRYTIKDRGSSMSWNASNIGGTMDTQDVGTPGGVNASNTVYITLSPQAKQWFDTNKDQLNLSDGKN